MQYREYMNLEPGDISRIIEMAWEDHTPFEAIESQFGLSESACIALMRRELKPSSFRLWRKRVTGRSSKHARLVTGATAGLKHRAPGQSKLNTKPKSQQKRD